MLKEIGPRISRVAILGNPANDGYARVLKALKPVARSLGMSLQIRNARRPDDFEPAFTAATREHAGAPFVFTDGMLLLHRTRIVERAAKHRLPTMYGTSEPVDPGGLMAYGPSMPDGFRRAATYVDKILKGAKPGDLPIEQPTKFELVINLKTAKALGLTIPPSRRAQRDSVPEAIRPVPGSPRGTEVAAG
ncbi:MAG: ABC transporter substrate-binding protein [Candidatus Rokubacteria bacterium]|nr:ABC transporter substrate-binding protein [Candidatus Rokubacteria bacterium]MBI3826485.1 ABC transporter substrate-binding protein [Candidatus Rokubacteria bacterium]